MILSVAMLLDWASANKNRPELATAAEAISTAVDAALQDDAARTPDLGGQGTTSGFAEAVAARVAG